MILTINLKYDICILLISRRVSNILSCELDKIAGEIPVFLSSFFFRKEYKMKQLKEQSLIKGNIFKSLISFAFPVLLALMVQQT